MRWRVISARVLLFVACASPLAAQITPSSTRVRVIETTRDSVLAVGTFVSRSGDAIVIATKRDPASVWQLRPTWRLEVSDGPRRQTGKGAAIGAAGGGLVGLLIGLNDVRQSSCEGSEPDIGLCPVVEDMTSGLDIVVPVAAGLIGAAAGAAVGALIGREIHHEDWRPAAHVATAGRGTFHNRHRTLLLSIRVAF